MSTIHALEKIQKKTIGLIGDVILDTYTFGHTKRVSPEAPVPVLSVSREEKKAGGVGNVALNAQALGMKVKLMARVGFDTAGAEVRSLLSQAHVDCSFVFCDPNYTTSVKNRFIASAQQLLRVDHETVTMLSAEQEELFTRSLDEWMSDVDLIAISDYAKGLLTDRMISTVISKAKKKGTTVIVDPKGNDFKKYTGATLIKPNYQEALMAVPLSERTLEKAAVWIHDAIGVEHVMITRSEEGISLYSKKEGLRNFPVQSREVRDVTGAGDTVLACLTAAMASNLTLDEAIPLANTSASLAIERIGCAEISMHDITTRLLDQNPTGKILSWKAFELAKEAFHQEELCFFTLTSSKTLHVDSLKRLMKQASSLPKSHRTVVLFQEESPDEHTLELIAGFDPVKWVVWGVSTEEVRTRFPSARFL